jgi:hypothetical protein
MSKIFVSRWVIPLVLMSLMVLMSLIATPCLAADTGLVWSGDLTVENTATDGQMAFDSSLQLKLEANGEDQRGVVIFKYLTPAPGLDSYELGELTINQAYIDLMLSPSLLLRTGRQKISWGSAFSWNPTNYIGSGKNRAEFMIDNPGVDAIDTEFTWENSALVLAVKPANVWRDSGKALKYSFRVFNCDLAVSGFEGGDPKAYGIDFATAAGIFTIYSEAAWKAGNHRFYIQGGAEQERPLDEYFLHGVVGINGNFSEDFSVVLEYYYNQEGWNQQEADEFNKYLVDHQTEPTVIGPLIFKKSALLADLRQNYLFLMIRKDNFWWDNLSMNVSILWNSDDQSYLLTPMIQYNIGQNAYLAINSNLKKGENTSEFGSLPFEAVVNVKVGLSF